MVPLNTPLDQRPDRRGHRGEGGRPVARLAERRAGLPAEPALAGQGACVVQRSAAGADRRARPRGRSRSCCSAKARPRSSSRTWPNNSASSTPTRCSRWSARTSSRCSSIETLLRPPEPAPSADEVIALRRSVARLEAHAARAACSWSASSRCSPRWRAAAARRRPTRSAATSRAARAWRSTAPTAATCARWSAVHARARDRRRLGRAARATRPRSTRWTCWSRRPTARACCATSPKCSPRRG